MGFFPLRVDPPVRVEPDPRGWLAYIEDRVELPEGDEPRLAIRSLPVADTDRVRIEVRDLAVHAEVLGFSVVATVPDVHHGEVLRRLGYHDWDVATDGETATTSLIVGVELADGSRTFPYRTADTESAIHRLDHLSGGSSTGPDQPGSLAADFVLHPVPVGTVRVVCSLAALGVVEAAATFDAGR